MSLTTAVKKPYTLHEMYYKHNIILMVYDTNKCTTEPFTKVLMETLGSLLIIIVT